MIAGIIPGNRGAVALLNLSGAVITTELLPADVIETDAGQRTVLNTAALIKMLAGLHIIRAVVETPPPAERSGAAFSQGYTFGILEGALTAFGTPLIRVRQQAWRGDLSIPTSRWPAVDRVNALCARHWPKFRFLKSELGHRQQLAALMALHAVQTSESLACAA